MVEYNNLINNNLTMKSSKIIRRLFSAFLLMASVIFCGFSSAPPKQQYYEIKIYHIADKTQESRVDAYLKDAYLPALHRTGIPTVGVFKPVESDTAFGKLVYVYIPFKTIDQYLQLQDLLDKDKAYIEAGKSFVDAAFDNPPYLRHESILLKAFLFMPEFVAPKFTTLPSERIYELRSYESATEAKAAKKIQMFNQGGEIALFESLKFNAPFYAEVIAGSQKPNLMYMTTFSDMKSHDEHWKAFGASDGWKKLSGLEEYKNTVSKAYIYLLHPTSYSDF
jgi:hypothetical protein